MADGIVFSDDRSVPGSFASGVHRHFKTFLEAKRNPESVLVEVKLADGTAFYCIGLWVTHIQDVPGCVMIHGAAAISETAVVVREDNIFSVNFQLPPGEPAANPAPFGFYPRQRNP